jgi:toxin ParE1/3/4
MTRDVIWAPAAIADYRSQLEYIAADSAKAAQLVKNRIDQAVRSLANKPLGRPGRVPGCFEK